ncbi:ligase-associated DNA damage response endonuclease PdeM [Asticcacaulis sp. AND118]|uniref:ligase-associated DNA damage response endonuclease PdeM n=1 Tax=Asticcacaulis sp. AND118 TaxID=2840468 RepID=UPI001D001044|nr:ligase-associated DNA damage response endonuclease PdeM [Asticcacaulis sp. AND118]UDF05324.1 ligase-associated DNA damage response endonuclease PdeM [Asticcacaulis sp. AND118]
MASTTEVDFGGRRMVLDADLALWWPAQRLLAVSDLHFEKSTFLAQFGSPIAPYDTLDTLTRLEGLIARYRPHSLVLLGDSFHDKGAWHRLEATTRIQLLDLCTSVDSCLWIEGNHDVGLIRDDSLTFVDDHVVDGIAFRHEPVESDLPQIVGHFHPKLTTRVRGHRVSGKCFAVNGSLLILPAFGSFTGGLDIHHQVLTDIAGEDAFGRYLVIGRTILRLR